MWGIPWYLMVKTPNLQCRGLGLIPGWRTKIPHATWPKKKKKKECGVRFGGKVLKIKSALVAQTVKNLPAM